MAEQVEQRVCIKFCIKLEHSSVETIWMIQKAAALGNRWLGASSRQHAHSRITSSAEFLWWNIKSPRWLSPPTAQIWCPSTSGFSQNLNYLWKGRDFRTLMRFRKIQWGSWWQLGELCEVPRCLLWRRLRGHYPMYNVSCLGSSSINVCFSYYMSGYLLDIPCISWKKHLAFTIVTQKRKQEYLSWLQQHWLKMLSRLYSTWSGRLREESVFLHIDTF